MTEYAAVSATAPARPARQLAALPRPSGRGVALLSIASFLVVLALLSAQMLRGEDPSLRAAEKAHNGAVERKVQVDRIVEHPTVTAADPAAPASAVATPAPVTTPSAPAPAPVSSPAPAPAAPVSTGSS